MPTTKSRSWAYWTPILIGLAILGVVAGHFWKASREEEVLVHSRTFPVQGGWGYDILVNEKVKIHQQFIPAVPGRIPFRTQAQADTVSQRVIQKIRAQQLPTISRDELRELGIETDSIPSR